MMTPADIYEVLRTLRCSTSQLSDRYVHLYALLEQVYKEQSEGVIGEFTGLFSRLFAVCKHRGVDHRVADALRRRLRRVLHHQEGTDERTYCVDVVKFAEWVSQFFNIPLPQDFVKLRQKVGNIGVASVKKVQDGEQTTCLRAIVTHTSTESVAVEAMGESLIIDSQDFIGLYPLLKEGQVLHLIEVVCSEGRAIPSMMVLEPDYLIDVSALTACLRPYGASPYNYILSQLSPVHHSHHILLGNAANLFMDRCIRHSKELVHENITSEGLYSTSIKEAFHAEPLTYCHPDVVIDKDYFTQARRHFDHIARVVAHGFRNDDGVPPGLGIGVDSWDVSETIVEPSFICSTLGLRGRFDVMTIDFRHILELKSGKADLSFPTKKLFPHEAHVMQMSLYKEILHFNCGIPRADIETLLFYSAYPHLWNQRSPGERVREVMMLRNKIVSLEMSLCNSDAWRSVLSHLTIDKLNEKNLSGNFYNRYLAPQIMQILAPLKGAEGRVKEYFCEQMAFLYREHFLNKTDDNRPGSTRGFSRVWRVDADSKIKSGDMIPDLRIEHSALDEFVEQVTFIMPQLGEDYIPNFGVGEMVQCYRCNGPQDNVSTSLLLRGYIQKIDTQELVITLAYPQRSKLFKVDEKYAVERDTSDVPMRHAMRGMYAFLSAPPLRQQLLLGEREPEVDEEVVLYGEYGKRINRIVLEAKRARDYYLLVGPPGTGKTNRALRAMVKEYLLSSWAGDVHGALLLMAYTNRAVDEICGMLEGLIIEMKETSQSMSDNLHYTRIGAEQSCHPDYRHRLLEAQTRILESRKQVVEWLQHIPIVVGTITSVSGRMELFAIRQCCGAIIDEASQVLEPQLMGLLSAVSTSHSKLGSATSHSSCSIPKFVLIGDHKQLPAVVCQSEKTSIVQSPMLHDVGLDSMANSLFQRLYHLSVQHGWHHAQGYLDVQGRMHPQICSLVNDDYYLGKLRPVPLPHQCEEIVFPSSPQDAVARQLAASRLVCFDVRPTQQLLTDKYNPDEAEMIARVVQAYLQLMQGGERPVQEVAGRIGVIVPFRNQVAGVVHAFRELNISYANHITVDTVECYQGSQRDIIIFGTTIHNQHAVALLSQPTCVDGILVDRKLNVAITRARTQFVLVGNKEILSHSPIYDKLWKRMESARN